MADAKPTQFAYSDHSDGVLPHGEKSPGVRRIEAITGTFTRWMKISLFTSIFLVAYAYGLDGTIRYTFQAYATNSYAQHSLLATINVLRAVIAAAAQPTLAKLMDVFGRFEVLAVTVVFYAIGTIVEAASTGVKSFAAGAVLFQIGYTAIQLISEVLIADSTSLRNRVLFSFIPGLPFVINTWVSGDVSAAVLKGTTWQWGIGMWALIYTLCATPLLATLFYASYRAKRSGALDNYRTPFQQMGMAGLSKALFWQLDVIGIILLIAFLSLILVPFTIAGGAETKWKQGHIIAMLVVGVCCVPLFVWWEMRAPHPVIPFPLLRDRGVWAGLGMAMFLNFSWYLQGDYLYTVLIVAFNESIDSATRITNIFSFTSVLVGTGLGIIVRYVRYLKPFIISGVILVIIAFGLLIRYRGGDDSSRSAIIGAQVVLGFGAGMFSYPTQASIQAAARHEHLAVITALYLSFYQIGSALGFTVSGAIWTQVLPGALQSRLTNQTLALEVYASPLTTAIFYPVGTPERDGIVSAYRHTQRLLCITGICLCLPLLAFAFLLRNPRLSDEQSSPNAEGGAAVRTAAAAKLSEDDASDVKA